VLAYITRYIKLKLYIILPRIYLQILRVIACSLSLIYILAALLMRVNICFIRKVYKSLKIGYSMVLALPSVLYTLLLIIQRCARLASTPLWKNIISLRYAGSPNRHQLYRVIVANACACT
jgi:hypothetical protein